MGNTHPVGIQPFVNMIHTHGPHYRAHRARHPRRIKRVTSTGPVVLPQNNIALLMTKITRQQFELPCPASNIKDSYVQQRPWNHYGPAFSLQAVTEWYARVLQDTAEAKTKQAAHGEDGRMPVLTCREPPHDASA